MFYDPEFTILIPWRWIRVEKDLKKQARARFEFLVVSSKSARKVCWTGHRSVLRNNWYEGYQLKVTC